MSKFEKIFKNPGSVWAYASMSATLTVIPEEFFTNGFVHCDWPLTMIVIMNRIWICVGIFAIANFIYRCYKKYRKSVSITRKNVAISIEYGDLYDEEKKGKIVINFDECFTTKVGQMPGDIKPNSVCGQYLTRYPIEDMQGLIKQSGVLPIGVSKFNRLPRYKLGAIVPNGDFLLMAFSELDKEGLSRMTYEHYLECLSTLWQQIDMYHGMEDVYMPILGSKITRLDKELTQQELLDVMLASYRLSPYKMKMSNTLHVICRRQDGFSLNNIEGFD